MSVVNNYYNFEGQEYNLQNPFASNGLQNVSTLRAMLEKLKDNPQELLMFLLYVYLPAKAQGLGNYVGNISKKLKEEAKFLNKWNELQQKMNEVAGDIRSNDPKQGGKDFKAYKKALEKFKAEFEQAIKDGDLPDNANTKDFIDTIKKSIHGLLYTSMDNYGEMVNLVDNKDQTGFKAYMNNFTTASTAFSSISNLTQEKMQLVSKLYDSLQSLDSKGLNYIVQQERVAVNNQKSS